MRNPYLRIALVALGLWALWRVASIVDALVGIGDFEIAETGGLSSDRESVLH